MRILIVDGGVPLRGADGGSGAVADLALGLARLGPDVFFYPDGRPDPAAGEPITGLTLAGEPSKGPSGLEPWLQRHGPSLDHAILSRPGPAGKYLPYLTRFPKLSRIFFGHDIHHHRLRDARAHGLPVESLLVRGMEALERHLWRKVDLVVYPSPEEAAAVVVAEPMARAIDIPIYRLDVPPPPAGEPVPARRDAMFVGGAAHLPNRDGVAWFAEAVLPPLRHRLPDFALHVIGAWPAGLIGELQRPGLYFHGRIDDLALEMRMKAVRMAVFPLRFGGGVKRKVVAALAQGLPVVTSPVGLQGLDPGAGRGAVALSAHSADDYADAIARLASDDDLWRRLARSGQDFARDHYGHQAYDDGLRHMLGAADAASARRRRQNAE